MSERHHGRLEGLLLSVVVLAASGLAVGGFWRVSQITGKASPAHCEAITEVHSDSLAKVLTLALALVALRRLTNGGQGPPT